ncbi:MAG TPA: hypothetical protein VFA75_11015 [Nevskia sp.]|nr:hypothetical protein [Nevskia sp.]
MSDNPFPKTIVEAVPYIVWGVLVFTAGFEGIASLLDGNFKRCGLAFGLMLVLVVLGLYWPQLSGSKTSTVPAILIASGAILILSGIVVLARQNPKIEALEALEVSDKSEASTVKNIPLLKLDHLHFVNGNTLLENLQWPIVNVYVKNWGTAPAFVYGQGVDHQIGQPPGGLAYTNRLEVPAGLVVPPGEVVMLVNSRPTTRWSVEAIQAILDNGSGVKIYGYVQYKDVDGNEQPPMTFCQVFKRSASILDAPRFFECEPPPFH